MAASLQVFVDGSWSTYSGNPPTQPVVYFKWADETATTGPATSDPFPTAGARFVRAYLHEVTGTTPAITAGNLILGISTVSTGATVNGLEDAAIPTAAGGHCVAGTLDTVTLADNKAAYLENPGSETIISVDTVTKGNADNEYDIVIEVHF